MTIKTLRNILNILLNKVLNNGQDSKKAAHLMLKLCLNHIFEQPSSQELKLNPIMV